MNFITPNIIDLEASGFGQDSYPIEVGVAMPDGRRYCSLIQPADNWQHWTDEAEQLHGISRELLKQKGLPAGEVCDHLNFLLAGHTVFSDGWVVDYPWLIKLFHAANKKMAFRVSTLEMCLSEFQMQHWHKVKQSLVAQSAGQRHRASLDAEVILQTFLTTKEMEQASAATGSN